MLDKLIVTNMVIECNYLAKEKLQYIKIIIEYIGPAWR